MRKTEREIKDFDEIVDVLARCDTVRVGMHGEEYPYVLPMSFGYEVKDGRLAVYIHGARVGMKRDLLMRDGRVCVEADITGEYLDLGLNVSVEFESVVGFGRAEYVEGEEALHGLRLVLDHCGFRDKPLNMPVATHTAVWRIDIESVTGKRRVRPE